MNWIPPNKHTFLVDCFTGSCCLSEGRITTDRCNVDTMVTTGRAVGVGITRDGVHRALCVAKKYIDWFEKTQLPFGFKNDDFNCFPSKNWSYMHLSKRYEVQNDQIDHEKACSDSDCKHCTIL